MRLIFLLFAPSLAFAQNAPLARTFLPQDTHRYRITLAVRTELSGKRPLPIGAHTYLETVAEAAEFRFSWRATRHIRALLADGWAEIDETLDEFTLPEEDASQRKGASREAAEALRAALAEWAAHSPRRLRYRESPSGQLSGLQAGGCPRLGESAPPVLTLWLLRALRPAAALPPRAVRFGEPWSEPRAVRFEQWTDVQASEGGEWHPAESSREPAVRLHAVQQISARVMKTAELPEAGPARVQFMGDGLVALSLADGRVLSGSRSASRELSWQFENVPGLPEAQRFAALLVVNVQLQECRNDPCLAPDDGRPGRR